MKNYESIARHCDKSNALSNSTLDGFLIDYATAQKRLHFKMNTQFKKYKHIIKTFGTEWLNFLQSQYIVHSVFKEQGMIQNLLNHNIVKNLPSSQYAYLQLMAAHPWRFCFSIIIDKPAKDFYQMFDVFSGAEFLLYSPGTSKILIDETPLLWANLIGYNGQCWQSFGPINYYNGFTPDDIFFFATELNPRIESENDLIKDIQSDPVPYMMLLSGAKMPWTVSGSHEIVMNASEFEVDDFDTEKMKKDFKMEYNQKVFWLQLKGWNEFPHFSSVYYDEVNKLVFLTSLTDIGFQTLFEHLHQYGYTFSPDAEIRVHLPMISTAGKILKKKISINPYESLFSLKSTPEEQDEMKNMNEMLDEIVIHLNAGTKPNVEALSKKYNQDPALIYQIIENIQEKTGKH